MRYMILHDRERDEGGEKEMALQGSQTRKRDFDVFLYIMFVSVRLNTYSPPRHGTAADN